MRSPVSLVANTVLRRPACGTHDSWTFPRKVLQRNSLPHGPCASIVT